MAHPSFPASRSAVPLGIEPEGGEVAGVEGVEAEDGLPQRLRLLAVCPYRLADAGQALLRPEPHHLVRMPRACYMRAQMLVFGLEALDAPGRIALQGNAAPEVIQRCGIEQSKVSSEMANLELQIKDTKTRVLRFRDGIAQPLVLAFERLHLRLGLAPHRQRRLLLFPHRLQRRLKPPQFLLFVARPASSAGSLSLVVVPFMPMGRQICTCLGRLECNT
jgi:hypothetical protein